MSKRMLGACLLALCGCTAAGGGRGRPLYPAPPQPLTRAQVALLDGYVGEVDGRDVTDWRGPFELLPGCHLVRTRSEWGADSEGAPLADTGPVPFALPMRAGYSYAIEGRTGVSTGPTGIVMLEAVEKDAAGNQTQVLGPARTQEDLDACRDFESELARPDGS